VIREGPTWRGDVPVALANILEIRFMTASALCEFLVNTITRPVAQTHPCLVLDSDALSAAVARPRGARFAVKYTPKCSAAFRESTADFIDWAPFVAPRSP
jgi:hypothetical protein